MRKLSLLLLVPLLCSTARAELRIPQPRADLGELRSGPALVRRFVLVNDGKQPVEIVDARTSCGCLKPRFSKMQLAPGEEGWVDVEVNTLSQPPGPSAWRVDVQYRQGEQMAETAVIITAQLSTEVMVEPASLNIITGQGVTSEIVITDLRPKALTVTSVKASSPHLKTILKEPCRDAGGHVLRIIQLEVTADYPEGRRDEVVSIYTDDPAYRELKVATTIVKKPRHRLTASPAEVVLSAVAGQPLPSRVVLIRDADSQDVVVERVVADDPAVTVSCAKGPGTNVTLRVQCDPEKLGTRPVQGAVHVHITSPLPQVLTIPVRVSVGP
ncbi:MAG: DUF1573 domain-containing protein [Gemmataceae bacterium]|nr:DUF1573 domain-containing protein [Gemmataceae bacterium]